MLGFTIDSIKLFLSWEELEEIDFDGFKKKLKNIKPVKKRVFGKQINCLEGFYRNFHTCFSESMGIFISGSISNYYKGFEKLLGYSELKQAIEKLSSELNLDLHNARLYRIDLALNIKTDNPVEQYSHYLFSDLSKFRRLEQDKGVLFITKKMAFSIYDKSLQLKEIKNISTTNILRLELRLLKGVSNFFGIKKMRVSSLYDSYTFLKLLYGFQNIYDRIEKARVPKNYSELEFISPKIQSQWLRMGNMIDSYGGEAKMYQLIEQAALEGKFKNANDKSRCRKDIRELSKNEFITKPHPLTLEISKKINSEIEKLKKSLTNT